MVALMEEKMENGYASGSVMISRETKKGREITGRSSESDGGEIVAHDRPASSTTVSVGRTLNMGDFNFARIEIGVTVSGAGQDAIDCAGGIANEILMREVASVLSQDRVVTPLDYADALRGRSIRVNYGMTKAMKSYESLKFDIAIDEPLTDGVPMEVAIAAVQAKTARYIERELARHAAGNIDNGF
jgi:hypothetical protein